MERKRIQRANVRSREWAASQKQVGTKREGKEMNWVREVRYSIKTHGVGQTFFGHKGKRPAVRAINTPANGNKKREKDPRLGQ